MASTATRLMNSSIRIGFLAEEMLMDIAEHLDDNLGLRHWNQLSC